MLDAYLRKGAQLLPLVGDKYRHAIEDTITSTIFSPLKYMSSAEAGRVMSWITGLDESINCEVYHVSLWKQFPSDEQSQNAMFIEPDLVIDGKRDGHLYRWIIELKWDATLDRRQIEDQERLCRNGYLQFEHLCIVKRAHPDATSFSASTILHWNQLAYRLSNVTNNGEINKPSEIWRRDILEFFERLSIRHFDGFYEDKFLQVEIDTRPYSFNPGFALIGFISVDTHIELSLAN